MPMLLTWAINSGSAPRANDGAPCPTTTVAAATKRRPVSEPMKRWSFTLEEYPAASRGWKSVRLVLGTAGAGGNPDLTWPQDLCRRREARRTRISGATRGGCPQWDGWSSARRPSIQVSRPLWGFDRLETHFVRILAVSATRAFIAASLSFSTPLQRPPGRAKGHVRPAGPDIEPAEEDRKSVV